jgi:hypothetical protein
VVRLCDELEDHISPGYAEDALRIVIVWGRNISATMRKPNNPAWMISSRRLTCIVFGGGGCFARLLRRPTSGSRTVGFLFPFVFAVIGHAAADSPGQSAPAEPSARDTPSQPNGDLFQSIWSQDTLTGDSAGFRKELLDKGITFDLQEQSEAWGNMVGGLKQGMVPPPYPERRLLQHNACDACIET